MATEEAFRIAVNIIRNLPKNGSFQPSPHVMLRFYGLYKQATEGKCNQPKPSFWSVISKAKWESWKCLGNMPKDEAMEKYLEEIKQIIETVSHSEKEETMKKYVEEIKQIMETMSASVNVANFMQTLGLGSQYESVYGISGDINGAGVEETESANLDTENNNKPVIEEGETLEEEQVAVSSVSPLATNMASLYASEKFYSDDESDDDYKDFLPDFNPQSKSTTKKSLNVESEENFTMTIQRLQDGLQLINTRLEALELHRKEMMAVKKESLSLPSWFPFKNVNLATVVVILGWPLLAQYLLAQLQHHRTPAV